MHFASRKDSGHGVTRLGSLARFAPLFLLLAAPVSAVTIDNDIASGTIGHFSVDVLDGGETRNATITASRFASGDITTTDLVYDYFSYVDVGSGGSRLVGSTPTSTGDDELESTGSFTGSGGNTIDWTVTSWIPDNSTTFFNRFDFTASSGTLGDIRLYQYLDEDVEDFSDDVFFTRGSPAVGDLRLFTIDDSEVFGVSHSGAFNGAQGLVDSFFAGWSVCEYNQMKPAISAGTQTVSVGGDVCASLAGWPIDHPQAGAGFGPRDIVSVMAWDVNSTANSATIITTLGGVPSADSIPAQTPEPSSVVLLLTGLGCLLAAKKRKADGRT